MTGSFENPNALLASLHAVLRSFQAFAGALVMLSHIDPPSVRGNIVPYANGLEPSGAACHGNGLFGTFEIGLGAAPTGEIVSGEKSGAELKPVVRGTGRTEAMFTGAEEYGVGVFEKDDQDLKGDRGVVLNTDEGPISAAEFAIHSPGNEVILFAIVFNVSNCFPMNLFGSWENESLDCVGS